MANLVWAVICQRAIYDQQFDSVSYIDMLDVVKVQSLPMAAPLAMVCTVWHVQEGEHLEIRSVAFSPQGEMLLESETVGMDIPPKAKRVRANIGLAGFNLATPGRYSFSVEVKRDGKWHEVGRVPMDIELMLPSSEG